jgi:O-antigen/teichoic acid export membrane protein
MKKFFSPKNIFQRFRGLFSLGISDILGAGISSLFWLYMATVIGPESYGELFYYFAIGNIAASVSLLGSKNTLMV